MSRENKETRMGRETWMVRETQKDKKTRMDRETRIIPPSMELLKRPPLLIEYMTMLLRILLRYKL